MRNILFNVFVIASIFIQAVIYGKFTVSSCTSYNYLSFLNCQDEWVEYVFSNGQWFKITHFIDGSIGVVPVAYPPED